METRTLLVMHGKNFFICQILRPTEKEKKIHKVKTTEDVIKLAEELGAVLVMSASTLRKLTNTLSPNLDLHKPN